MSERRYLYALGLAADQRIDRTSRSGSPWLPTVEEMYLICNDRQWAKETGHLALHGKYRQFGYGRALGLCTDGRVRPAPILDIQPLAIVPCIRITTSSGIGVCVGNDQPVLTPGDEEAAASDVRVGDELLLRAAEPSSTNKSYRLTSGTRRGGGYGQRGFPSGQSNPGWVDGGHARFEAHRRWLLEHIGCCQQCGAARDRLEVHHLDGCRLNNEEPNLRLLCVSCHKKADYRLGRTRRGEKGYEVVCDRVVDVQEAGERLTYGATLDRETAVSVGRLLLVLAEPRMLRDAGRFVISRVGRACSN